MQSSLDTPINDIDNEHYFFPDYFLLLSFWRQDSKIASIGNLIIWKLLNAMGMGISRAPFPFKYIGFLAAPGCDEWTFVRDSPTKIYTLRRRVDIWRDGNQVIFFQKSGHLKHFALLLQLLLLKFTRFFHTIFTNTSSQISNTPDGNVKDEFACYKGAGVIFLVDLNFCRRSHSSDENKFLISFLPSSHFSDPACWAEWVSERGEREAGLQRAGFVHVSSCTLAHWKFLTCIWPNF